MSSLVARVRTAARRLLPRGAEAVMGVSGGPDSQALLDVLAQLREELGISLCAVGVNHGLRPEAAEELEFACQLAGEHHVPFVEVSVHIPAGENVMAAARGARYRALHDVAHQRGAERIAVAHTASDQVEGILLNLTRGSGLRGARGMRPKRGRIVRPMLDVTRAEILAYLEERGIRFATDPSNSDAQRARAALRGSVVPALRRLNPAVERAFGRFARAARDDDAFLAELARQELETRTGLLGSLAITGFSAMPGPIAIRLIAQWLRQHGLRANQRGLRALVAACRTGEGSRTVAGAQVRVEGDRLWRLDTTAYSDPLPAPGAVHVDPLDIDIRGTVDEPAEPLDALAIGSYAAGGPVSVAFDRDRLHLDIKVRSWNEGDRFQPFGLDGHTKVGDLFTDRKIPRALRAVWPLVVHGDEVLWVVGLRRGSGAPLGADTKRVLTLTVEGTVPGW